MANWASSKERFVEVPGVVEIRWESDDPDYYVKPTDLFDQQAKNEGLPDWYGKKDKATTEQAFFTCNVCECDLKSVVTLRAHCKGTQHIRKALQKKKEYRDAQKLLKKKDVKTEEASTKDCKTLFSCLEKTSEPVVGLENITEYKSSSDPEATPFYHCNLDGCYDDQGDCKQMMLHIMVARHKQSWLRAKTGSAPQRSSEISQKIAEFTKDYKRDYRLIKEVEDDEKWKKCRSGKIRTPREERPERNSWGKEEKISWGKEERRSWGKEEGSSRGKEERRSWQREEHKGGRSRVRDDREERRSWKREGTYDNERDYKRRRSSSREAPSWNHQDDQKYRGRSRERSHERSDERGERREIKPDRDEGYGCRKEEKYSEERERERRRDDDRGRRRNDDVDRTRDNGYVKREEDGSERRREHDDRESERVEYKERRDNDVRESSSGREAIASSSSQPIRSEESQQETTIEAAIDTLHRKVAACVKARLSMYFVELSETLPENMKIKDAEEYTKLAKDFSHKMREQIKETYEQYHRTMEGITLTPDNKEQIKLEIEMFFERRPVIKLYGLKDH